MLRKSGKFGKSMESVLKRHGTSNFWSRDVLKRSLKQYLSQNLTNILVPRPKYSPWCRSRSQIWCRFGLEVFVSFVISVSTLAVSHYHPATQQAAPPRRDYQTTGWVKKSKLIISEHVNKTEKIGRMWTNKNSCRENEVLSDIFTWNILRHSCFMFKYSMTKSSQWNYC